MRVMLIKKFPEVSMCGEVKTPPMEVGDKFTVIGQYWDINRLYYLLEEFGTDLGFRSTHFSPLAADLDETELVTEEFEEKYCVPANK
jgi:hypothetical protein